ncbi:CoA transferase [Sphingomonas sp. RB3P16]|uniref:CaiB/BaiF CoA transferase family protein n=1 Tax=Parasphingomonas frigoris TaxID=3096163 RepID=UPI002FC7E451
MAGPLEGITVIDLTSVVAGPLATQLFAQQGARVLKIEPPEGDRARALGAIAAPGFSAVHATLNAGKASVGLDLAQLPAREILMRLIAGADIVIHNFRPGVDERLGLDSATLHRQHPRLVIARITGFGQEGPMSAERAYDPIVQAEAGMTVRDATGEPRLAPQWVCDKTAGLYAAQAVSAALVARERTNRGCVVDISMMEAAVAYGWIDVHGTEIFAQPLVQAPDIAAVYRPWRTRDGWVVIVMLSQAEFAGWARALGVSQVFEDPRFADMASRFRNWDALRAIGAPHLADMTTTDATARLRMAGVPCGVANDKPGVRNHPQLDADGYLVTREDPRFGPTTTPLPVARFDGLRDAAPSPAEMIGAATRKTLVMLGLASDVVDAAFASGAAHSHSHSVGAGQ